MQKLTISLPHQLERAEARKRTQEFLTQFRQQYGGAIGHVQERWNGDTMGFTFLALGLPITGQAHIEDRLVRVEVDLPGMLGLLSSTIKHSIEQQGTKMLSAR